MEQEKKCENCKFFIQHYYKATYFFQKMIFGHCTNSEIPWKVRKRNVCCDSCCDKWESGKDLKAKNRESIIAEIRKMKKTLTEIAQILSDD